MALVDAIATEWQKYLEGHILCKAYGSVASHQLTSAADNFELLENGLYAVPSATSSTTFYEVLPDVGACACPVKIHRAFCKHQALVHRKFGGQFTNARALGTDTNLDKCPPHDFFMPFLRVDETH